MNSSARKQAGGLDFELIETSLDRTTLALLFADLILSSFATVLSEVNFFRAVNHAAACISVWKTQSSLWSSGAIQVSYW